MTPKQLATLESMPDQIMPLWEKLGGKYAEYTEDDLHRIAHEKGITTRRHRSFAEYDSLEANKAVAFFIKLKAGFQQQWNKHWMAERDARQASLAEDQKIVAECMTWEDVKRWMAENDSFYKYIERFEFVKKLAGIGYWKKREPMVRLLTHREARTEYEGYRFSENNIAFERAYDLVVELGWDGALFKRKFTFTNTGKISWMSTSS